jgi:hypothetical protein
LCLCVGSGSTKRTDCAAYKVWHDNIDRVRGDRLWILYVQKRRYIDGLVERKYGGFVSVNLDPSLPQRKLYQNLCGLGVVNALDLC